MTYRELYAKHVKLKSVVDSVHLRVCPGAMNDLGEKIDRTKVSALCPYRDCAVDDDFQVKCAECWDREIPEEGKA